eukprot:747567-Hanusia_phi.AAC.1
MASWLREDNSLVTNFSVLEQEIHLQCEPSEGTACGSSPTPPLDHAVGYSSFLVIVEQQQEYH